MPARIIPLGNEGNPLVVIDQFMDTPGALVDYAQSLAPFAAESETFYPGLRYSFGPEDELIGRHVMGAIRAVTPLMLQAFGVRGIRPVEASFSMVTSHPEDLTLHQRLPHYDRTDDDFFAILHYLSPAPKGGTSFYRHKGTGFERVSAERAPIYAEARQRELDELGPPPMTYYDGSDEVFERIARLSPDFNRLLIYRGCVLHSADIPANFNFSNMPATGRLTFNMFAKST